MVRLEVNNGTFVEDYNCADVPTVLALVQKFQDDHRFRFASSPLVYDPSQGPTGSLTTGAGSLPYDTAIIDNRTYAMTCWITAQYDENGNPVKRSVLI